MTIRLTLTSNEFERTTAVADRIFHNVPDISWEASSLVSGYLFPHYRHWKHAAYPTSFLIHDDDAWWMVKVVEIITLPEEDRRYFESMTVEIDSTYSPESLAVLDLEPKGRQAV